MRTVDPARVQRILDSAARLFGERHYHEVRIEDIATRAGVAKGTVYQHFKDKEDLYLALILRGLQGLFEEMRGQTDTVKDPEEKLLAFVREGIRFSTMHPYFMELIQQVNQSRSAAQAVALQASRTQFFDLLIGILAELSASGRWTVKYPELAAQSLMGTIREVLRWQTEPIPDLSERIVHQFLHGLTKAS